MNKLILRAILFAGIMTLYLVINFCINNYMIEKSAYKLPKGKTVLVLGDSHLKSGLNPKVATSCANICIGGEPYFLTHDKLKFLKERNQLDTVIIGFGYHNVSSFQDEKLVRQEILAEQSQVKSGENPPKVMIAAPQTVQTGDKYSFDLIVDIGSRYRY